MHIKTLLTFLFTTLFLSSCGLISVETHGMYSHYEQTKEQYPHLLVKTEPTADICDLKPADSSKVYIIKGEQLKQCLADYDDAYVYIWAAHCKSGQCYSPTLLQKYCDDRNIELFLVTEYYDGKELEQYFEIERPMFGIDTEYYQTDYIDKYIGKFEHDLTSQDKTPGRMMHFKKGQYIGKTEIELQKPQ